MSDYILEVNNLNKEFKVGLSSVKAVNNVSIKVKQGEVIGIVGESGSGKSTLAKLISGLERSDSGEIIINGTDIARLKGSALNKSRKDLKMIFQEPRSSFDPRLTIGVSIIETLKANGFKGDSREKAVELLKNVELGANYFKMKPTQVSGGECQRAAIARAIAGNPKLLICDEVTSALDVSVQALIVDLLKKIQKESNMTILFISHDLALVSSFCDRTYVMNKGSIVEYNATNEIINNPQEEYTRKLIGSILVV